MCFAIPGKVISIKDGTATVDYSGERREAKVIEANIKTGDYVLVQAGLVLQKVPKEEALLSLKAWNLK